MPLSRGARSIPRAEEKSVFPPTSISPAATVLKPAMASSSVVLPAPDGPKIEVTRASNEASTANSKSASGRRQRSSILRLFLRAQQPLRAPDEHERQHDSNPQQQIRFWVLA